MVTNRCYGEHTTQKQGQYITIDSGICPICKSHAHVVTTSQLYWCPKCQVPLYQERCDCCGSKGRKFTADCRVVFPEEKHLLEVLFDLPVGRLDAVSVWNSGGNLYYFDGKRTLDGKRISLKTGDLRFLTEEDISAIQKKYTDYDASYGVKRKDYVLFEQMVERFVKANEKRYHQISSIAMDYIRKEAEGFSDLEMFVSFSGGKDSTVVADLVRRALSNSSILHIYGDTTLEFPFTKEYVSEYKKTYTGTLLLTASNQDKEFYKLCEELGPPSRVMRWCCTIFKTGAINRRIEAIFRDKTNILSFQGIRWNESASRSKYEKTSTASKISKQKVAAPIIEWFDFDVWLYILTRKIPFNAAYRLGYTRVGCWCCPNNSTWSEFLSRIFIQEQYAKFHQMLLQFAHSTGKKNPESYVDNGNWKARQGGNGLAMAQNSKIKFAPCVEEKNAFRYELKKPIDETLYELFKPFGKVNTEIGNKRLGEVYVLDANNRTILRIQGRRGSTSLRVIAENPGLMGDSVEECKRKVDAQITKFQMCMACRACESVCKFGAISTRQFDGKLYYNINDKKCVKCRQCISHFTGGCYMRKVLTIKR